jgi:hypothetical protein
MKAMAKGVLVSAIALAHLSFASGVFGQTPHWRETANETIWMGKYSNCDHGYYVLLPSGVIGHSGSLPPAPNHGFQIDLANRSKTLAVQPNSVRTFWVWDSPGFESESGDSKPVDSPGDTQSAGTTGASQFLRRTFLRVGGQKAVHIHSSLKNGEDLLLEDDVNFYSADAKTEYQFKLITPKADYAADKHLFDQVLAGFRFTTIPDSECSND